MAVLDAKLVLRQAAGYPSSCSLRPNPAALAGSQKKTTGLKAPTRQRKRRTLVEFLPDGGLLDKGVRVG